MEKYLIKTENNKTVVYITKEYKSLISALRLHQYDNLDRIVSHISHKTRLINYLHSPNEIIIPAKSAEAIRYKEHPLKVDIEFVNDNNETVEFISKDYFDTKDIANNKIADKFGYPLDEMDLLNIKRALSFIKDELPKQGVSYKVIDRDLYNGFTSTDFEFFKDRLTVYGDEIFYTPISDLNGLYIVTNLFKKGNELLEETVRIEAIDRNNMINYLHLDDSWYYTFYSLDGKTFERAKLENIADFL